MATESPIRWEQEDDIVLLTLDAPEASTNTIDGAFRAALGATVERLEFERDSIAGVILTSGKRLFLAGANLEDVKGATAEDLAGWTRETNANFRRLETLGIPVVSAINGTALGGGFEICLATHHRIALDAPGVVFGFPEVQLGLLPGGGGIVRTVRLLGITNALTNWLLEGKRRSPAEAAELGLIDEVVATAEELLPAAKAWIRDNPGAGQPWDAEGYRIPGGTPSSPSLAANLPAFPSNLRKQLKGANYPAPKAIMAAAVEGAQVNLANAHAIESRYFASLFDGQVAKNMIQAFFFDMQAVNGKRGRPADVPTFVPNKVVVLGAGMMGAGITYVCAKAGVEVVLKDVSQEAADRGKAYSERLVTKGVERGRTTQAKGEKLLSLITATVDPAAAAGADCVIEAVFEDPAVKADVFAEIEPHLAPDALLASNTSTLPITELATGVSRPQDFVGLHFFSPVDKMPLLEIIKGEQTSDETLYRALDVAKLIKKTPIVVNDSRGFFTSRVIGTFINESLAMVGEGIAPSSIEQASGQAGYPAPALQLIDELNIALMAKVRDVSRAAAEVAGDTWSPHPAEPVMDAMLATGRPGRVRGAGFYDYIDGKRCGLWSGLAERFPPVDDPSAIPLRDLCDRMLFIEAIEAVRCLDEGVIEVVADANVGSIIGIGFPGWTGGVLQFINGYEDATDPERRGVAGFVARAAELAGRYGERFTPPESLTTAERVEDRRREVST